MVETTLRGRPTFGTFLQSDTTAGEDGISYYEYQRHLRAQKVALLQEKRASAHVPGTKRPTSRKLFQVKTASPTHCAATINVNAGLESKPEATSEQHATSQHCVGPSVDVPPSSRNVAWKVDNPKHPETERLPRISAYQHRSIKSATARSHRVTWPGSELHHHAPRPSTVAGIREADMNSKDIYNTAGLIRSV